MSSIDYSQYKEAVYDNLVIGIVYGAYIVVFVTSVYVLLSKPGFTSSQPRIIMFGVTTFMFTLGIIALILETTLKFREAQSIFDPNHADDMPYYLAWATITCLMYILCDIICVWRTVVLWNKDKRVIVILVLSNLGATAAAGCHCVLVFGILQSIPSHRIRLSSGNFNLFLVCPILGTNLLSTGLIFWKAWQYRISVRKHLCEGRGIVRVDRVFALLVESGLIYCCVWIYYCVANFTGLPNPGFTPITFISGFYPTLIIILVSMQISPVEHYTRHSIEVQSTRSPALVPPRDDNMPRQLVTIQRKHTSDFDTPISSTALIKPSDEEKGLLQRAL